MENAIEEKSSSGEAQATERQWTLCQQLYAETGYERQYTEAAFMQLTREEASKHIAFLKEYKLRAQQEALNNHKVNGFDKISFGMVYKMVWKDAIEKASKGLVFREDFLHRCYEEYILFKDAAEYTKRKVAGSGQQ